MARGASMAPAFDESRYRAESDHRTLCDAADIRSDKKRLAAVADVHRSITAKHKIVGRSLRGRGRR